jgi:hypothetical protein
VDRPLPPQVERMLPALPRVSDYDASVPDLADRYDLFADTFALSCLNRLQLRDNPLATRLRA